MIIRYHIITVVKAAAKGVTIALMAIFFTAHPIQTEAVNFLSARDDILMTLFYFAAILFYQKTRIVRGPKSVVFYTVSLVMYFLSCLSKEIGITLPLIAGSIVIAAILIGLITFILSYLGVYIGKRFGHLFESKIEALGGVILVGIGIKILIEHLFF